MSFKIFSAVVASTCVISAGAKKAAPFDVEHGVWPEVPTKLPTSRTPTPPTYKWPVAPKTPLPTIQEFRKRMVPVLKLYLPKYATRINRYIQDEHVNVLMKMLRTGQKKTKKDFAYMVRRVSHWILEYVVDHQINHQKGLILNKAGLATKKTKQHWFYGRNKKNLHYYKQAMQNTLSQVNW